MYHLIKRLFGWYSRQPYRDEDYYDLNKTYSPETITKYGSRTAPIPPEFIIKE